MLELEGDGARSSCSTATPTAPTPGATRSPLLARRGRRAIAVDLPGFGTADPLRSATRSCPQLDDVRRRRGAATPPAARDSRCSRSATPSVGASRCASPSATDAARRGDRGGAGRARDVPAAAHRPARSGAARRCSRCPAPVPGARPPRRRRATVRPARVRDAPPRRRRRSWPPSPGITASGRRWRATSTSPTG